MANPTDFPEKNDVLRCPKEMPGCQDLNIHRTVIPTQIQGPEGLELYMQPLIISCWELTEKEKDAIIKSGKLYLGCWSNTQPPIMVYGTSPFNPLTTEG